MKYLFPVLLMLCYSNVLFGQEVPNSEPDSLELEMIGLHQNATTAFNEGDFKVSLAKFKALAAICQEQEMDTIYASTVNSIGTVFEAMAYYEEAIVYYKKAQVVFERIFGTHDVRTVSVVNNIAVTYIYMEKFEEAEALSLEVIRLWEKVLGKQHPHYAVVLNNLGALYQLMHRYEQAITMNLEAKAIRLEVYGKEHELYAASLNNLGMLYKELKNYDTAIPMLEEALDIRARVLGAGHPKTAESMNNLALTYQKVQNFDQAEQLNLKSLNIRAKQFGKKSLAYAQGLNSLGSFYSHTKRYERALSLYKESCEIREVIGSVNRSDYFKILNNMLHTYTELEEFEAARMVLQKVLVANVKSAVPDSVPGHILPHIPQFDWHAQKEVMLTLVRWIKLAKKQYKMTEDKAFLEEAYLAVEVAIKLNEIKRNSFDNSKNKLLYLDDLSDLVLQAIQLGEQLSIENKELYTDQSFRFAEQNKSMLLAEALKGNRAIKLGDLPDSIALKETRLQYELNQLKIKENNAADQAKKTALRSEINEVNLEIKAFLKFLKTKYPKYHALKYENMTAGIQEVQALLDDKTLFLEYFLADSASYLFAISKESAEIHRLDISAINLKIKIRGLRQQLSNYKSIIKNPKESYLQFSQRSEVLYEYLLKDALASKEVENLVIVADGELGHIPFGIFLLEPANQDEQDYKKLHYLLKDYNVSYNYSATLFAETQQQNKKNRKGRRILACAATYPALDSATLLERRSVQMAKTRLGLNPLPAVKAEVAMLSELSDGDFVFDEACNEAFFKEEAPNYDIIHLAMHGIVHDRLPILSALVFTENMDTIEDNFLQAYEIAHLKLNANLVVLSACETGYGKFEQGEGVLSLARSFMYAGVPSLVVSLWQVNDASTAMIMEGFYKNLALGMTKDAALRQAKLKYMDQAEGLLAHPAFWSPFIQLGDKSSLKIAQKTTYLNWLLGILISLCLIFGGWKIYARRKK